MIACPCCANLTLEQRAADEICPVCFWHDDGQDDADAAVVRGGPNYRLSLTDARYNYRAIGACEARFLTHARAPTATEARR
ncbi:CPCC family cysteine-rich protein [Sphingomonas sp.]|uniref:CPCC family cysteine-rich protein n=1 Tax=Sphingomonas sp. TaxID=28214 RepID=UPI003CC578BA